MPAWLTRLDAHFPVRYATWLLCALGCLLLALLWAATGHGATAALALAALTVIGLRDVRQTRHSVLRNYPVIGHLRFLLEWVRPEIRQYFIESDNEAEPFSRQQRARSTSGPRASPTSGPSARSSTCMPPATSGSTTRWCPRTSPAMTSAW